MDVTTSARPVGRRWLVLLLWSVLHAGLAMGGSMSADVTARPEAAPGDSAAPGRRRGGFGRTAERDEPDPRVWRRSAAELIARLELRYPRMLERLVSRLQRMPERLDKAETRVSRFGNRHFSRPPGTSTTAVADASDPTSGRPCSPQRVTEHYHRMRQALQDRRKTLGDARNHRRRHLQNKIRGLSPDDQAKVLAEFERLEDRFIAELEPRLDETERQLESAWRRLLGNASPPPPPDTR